MKIVIAGAGEVGSHLAKMLRNEANDVTVIDDDQSRIESLRSYTDVESYSGSPSSIKVLRLSGVPDSDLFIAVYPKANQEINIVSALLAKRLGAKKVIARINDEDCLAAENKLLYKELGIDLLLYPERTAADEIIDFLKHNSTSDTMEFARGKLQIGVFKLNPAVVGSNITTAHIIEAIERIFVKFSAAYCNMILLCNLNCQLKKHLGQISLDILHLTFHHR